MHEAFTTTTTKNYVPSHPDDLLPSIYFTSRPQTTDSVGWLSPFDSDRETTLENQPFHLNSARRVPPAGLQKLSLSTTMASHTENGINRSNRWYFNPNGQLVDADALADEIVRLNIGDAARETADDAPIRTPPKSKLASAAVAQLEASPLETNSTSSANSSPHASDHQINVSHSRGSSTDTTVSSQESAASSSSNTMLAQPSLKNTMSEVKERPHSFSGGLSSADLRRLQQADEPSSDGDGPLQQQQQQWASTTTQYRESAGEQLSYPSLTPNDNNIHRPQPQHSQQPYDYRSGSGSLNLNREDAQIDYNMQHQRNFNAQAPGMAPSNVPTNPAYVQGRPNNGVPATTYRQPPRTFPPQQGLLPSPGYAVPPHHTSHLSLGNSQQLYDMMLPGAPHDSTHPAVSRVQQQHNVFPRAHHHSASDPSAIRDAAALALLNNNMQPFAPGMFPANLAAAPPAMPMYPAAYYGGQDAYRADPAAAAAAVMATRLQAQYTGQYAMVPPQLDAGIPSPSSSVGNQSGPSANNRKLGLYKTELCRSWEEKGSCRYGTKCQFAHGEDELRKVARHPKYKTEICRTFWVSGSCPYGKRCCFIHTELPANGTGGIAAPGSAEAVPPAPPRSDGRARSMSTNSDPNEGSVSLLARISAKRTQDTGSNSSSTPVDNASNSSHQPPKGSLRVVTSSLDGPSIMGQNKSAYPTFAGNGVLLPAPEHITAKSPAPVTAGPDLGRHNNARFEIVGYNQRLNKTPPSNVRHSASGSEDFSYQASQSVSGNMYPLPSGDGNSSAPRANGHVRAGSAGNWGSLSRSGQFPASAYPHAPSPAGEVAVNSPWSTTELTMGPSRLNEKAWA